MPGIEFTEMQKDAIAEVMNISMGNAATAASELLNAKVWITTPRVEVKKAKHIHDMGLEPAVCVKIVYIKGITGTNLMVLKQSDVQLILNQLMSQPLVVTEDFEFDEISISAVSEVMNQMMGSSATALSSFLGIHIDISTPTPYIMEEINLADIQDYEPEEEIVAVNFDLTIEGVIKSNFVSVMSKELAKMISDKIMGDAFNESEEVTSLTANDTEIGRSQDIPNTIKMPDPPKQQPPPPQQMQQQPVQQQYPQYDMNQQPQMMQQPPMMQQPMYQMPPPMQAGYPMQMPMQPPYGYGGYPPPPVNIQNAQFHQFEQTDYELTGEQKDNLKLLMGVPLQVSVEIGTAKRKVKEILEFQMGTIIELERQAGAPVDIVVNGNLIARGDVVVIDDNFAVRITEILKSKLIDSLGKE
jgi:flagellar motor switch protein FliN/FliY